MVKDNLYSKVLLWLTLGVFTTFITGYAVSLNETMLYNLFKGGTFIFLIVVEIAIAIFFSLRISKMSKMTAIICYILYSFITGLTFSSIFITYKLTSVLSIFLVTSILFLVFGLIGYKSKANILSIGKVLLITLIGIILVTIINIFLKSSTLEIIVSIIGMILFIAYIMYDMKKVEVLANVNPDAGPIYAAFQLYLDFINLFIELLKIFGKERD